MQTTHAPSSDALSSDAPSSDALSSDALSSDALSSDALSSDTASTDIMSSDTESDAESDAHIDALVDSTPRIHKRKEVGNHKMIIITPTWFKQTIMRRLCPKLIVANIGTHWKNELSHFAENEKGVHYSRRCSLTGSELHFKSYASIVFFKMATLSCENGRLSYLKSVWKNADMQFLNQSMYSTDNWRRAVEMTRYAKIGRKSPFKWNKTTGSFDAVK
jgi:hypothetical protein